MTDGSWFQNESQLDRNEIPPLNYPRYPMTEFIADLLVPFEPILLPLVGEKCHTSLFKNVNLGDTACLKLFISKGLGVGLIVGGSIVKLPQILKIFSSGSVEGISYSSYILETIAFTISVAYNSRNDNPFTTYGEQVFLLAQNLIIIALILGYNAKYHQLGGVMLAFLAALFALFQPTLAPPGLLGALQGLTILIGIASRVPQILSNYTNRSVGQLSSITILLISAGSVARVFTTLQEVNDPLLMVGAVVAAALNVVLASQCIAYPSGPPKTKNAAKSQ
ncbi:mannose-P-dolichol utilization defect 1 protein [Gonapodya prolifera JEL478]|uniref:Mannose-P-dolichol utilization defect 1 protein homolog n=1 Tax=Gonapodya prolifera (strain JEL478) TaxID=1344416 RepID=A0A139ALC8_GONPJ|nr:mannose-P-dolichol utilization defect 1 protein [Gonapodya prolifera JEL478]|eukprot:KXS17592.1 mannose-P-dolichol utilization defect 1 protein [Gonapodya prolifera JEL478]